MAKKILLVVVFNALFFLIGNAQSASSDTTGKSNSSSAQEEEVVDGFWSVTAYFGKKLVDGMSERLNLDDEEAKQEVPKKKVVLRIGTFEIERIEGG